MQYEKQTFVNGQVLTAECLNRMEDGIKGACDAVPPACDSADCSKVLSYGANGYEWVPMPNGGGSGGSVAPMIVTIRDERPSHTADSIIEHLANGGNAILIYNEEYLALDHYDDELVSFVRTNVEEGIAHQVDIYNDGTFDAYVFQAAGHSYVTDLVPTDAHINALIDAKLDDFEGGGSITVDDALDPNSTNPVQNKVITALVDEIGKSLEQIEATTPVFDLSALGISPVPITGGQVMLETDASAICSALDNGPVTFVIPAAADGDTIPVNMTMVGTKAGEMYQCISIVNFISPATVMVVIEPTFIGVIVDALPNDDHINSLIDAKLGVIENGTY